MRVPPGQPFPADDLETRLSLTENERRRVVIERVQPEIDDGRFAIKRTLVETVEVTADIFADGHDLVAGVLKYRITTGLQEDWLEVPLVARGNDSWTASFRVTELGEYQYTLEAWVDRFGTWLRDLNAKLAAGQDVLSELLEGADLIERAVHVRLKPDITYEKDPVVVSGFRRTEHNLRLLEFADLLRRDRPFEARIEAAQSAELRTLMDARPDRSASTEYDKRLRVTVDRVRARYGAWYEMFPRSATTDPSRSGTFREAEAELPRIADMGFNVLYLPPIHPIGHSHRKGRNNALSAAPGDPGSPWAIGSAHGGHTSVDPALGTPDDFDRFVAVARNLGLEVALDLAIQASPDHPWVREHPEWFRHRPDGSIKYAENPPKKYQDIYPLDFESADSASLRRAVRDAVLFWIGHGVRIFRVDNPHTKPFAFWEWLIDDIRRDHPDAIFLSEAFTRPAVMRYLAKVGFSQSYTYFTWRNTPDELREYLIELTATGLREYLRPNFFANTPDILHEYLQTGGRPAFEVRLILAAMLCPSYGIYSGFELCENVPLRAGSEEYLHSEKYEIKPRDWSQADGLDELIARVNEIRGAYPSLQFNDTLRFHETDNPAFLCFSKKPVFVVVNTDARWMQHGHVRVPAEWTAGGPYIVEDLLDGARYPWRGEWNYVKLDPAQRVAHIFVITNDGSSLV
jgi:starch synthase (maltosyl-transferring)